MASTSKFSSSSCSKKTQRPPTHACLCSPTTHPGSFRCSLHRTTTQYRKFTAQSSSGQVVRNQVTVGEGSRLLKSFLMQMIRPSKQNLCRRKDFQPKPTRFSLMNGSDHEVAVL
ncbi:hypothetical protein QJS04_geneDACA005358 [Acorus gramineus]|uniref:Serine-rich protein-related n=1 Tax=Acorus gramineus TaxID=55184 RepID=A0AAV9AY24_ACOGR|nr:hypothetical protein QJS04_geneDACA005358 [Acorus gramineus]